MDELWRVFKYLLFIVFVLANNSLCVEVNDTQGISKQGVTYKAVSGSSVVAKDTMIGCSLIPVSPSVQSDIATLIENDAKLIKVSLDILNDNGRMNESVEDEFYRPWQWKIANGYSGKSLLFLKDPFEAMSAETLAYGVETLTVELKQEPKDCLVNATRDDIERYINELIINNFDEKEASAFPPDVEVCSRHFKEPTQDKTGAYGLVYMCCRRTENSSVECLDLEGNFWVGFLSKQIILIQLLFVLLSPFLLPESVYRLKSRFLKYTFEPSSDEPMKLNVMKIDADVSPGENFKITRRHWFVNLTKLKDALRRAKPGVVQEFNVTSVAIAVRASKIIPDNFAPVGLFNFLKNFIIRCKLRQEVHEEIVSCCNGDMCRLLPCKRKVYWYACLKYFMGAIMAAVCTIPWLFRVWFYYEHEETIVDSLKHTLAEKNVTLPYTGSLLIYLSPTHALFMAIYILLPAEVVLFVLLPASFKRKLKFTARQCFRDMRETPKLDACALFIAHLFWPLKYFGIVGCIIWPLWLCVLPLSVCLLAVQVFPIVNVSFRMFVNVVYYIVMTIYPGMSCTALQSGPCTRLRLWLSRLTQNVIIVDTQERNNRGNKIVHAFALLMSFITMWMIIIILIECVSFYVECGVYIVIGVILNSNKLMKYVSLLLLITWYGYDCFNGVFIRYVSFNKFLNAKVRQLVGDKCREVAMLSEDAQNNTAFAVDSTHGRRSERMSLVAGSEGYLKWRASRLLLFLDESDVPRIPKQFLFAMSKLAHSSCPGRLHLLYLKAAVEFGMILLFLMFVFVVILAFGRAADVSSANQTLATLAGGFLPFVFRKFLFKSHEGPGLDEGNLKWQGLSSAAIENFTSRWNFADISVTPCKQDQTTVANDQLESSSLNLSACTTADVETERDIVEQISDVVTLPKVATIDVRKPLLNVVKQEITEPVDLIVRFRYKAKSLDEVIDYFVPKQQPDNCITIEKGRLVDETVL